MRNIKHGTIAGLLVVVATLLVINLAIIAPGQEAQAQRGRGRLVEAVAFELAGGGGPGGLTIWRIFSDGTVETNQGFVVIFKEECSTEPVIEWCGWEAVPE